MKVIKQAVMPNGTKIQLEDWSDKNTKEYSKRFMRYKRH